MSWARAPEKYRVADSRGGSKFSGLGSSILFLPTFTWVRHASRQSVDAHSSFLIAGISRDSRHKRRATGGKQKAYRKKRKFELGRPPAMTKLGAKRIHPVRVRGGAIKFRALRLESGNFSWGSECT